MNEIAEYIVNGLRWYAVKLCEGDRFKADDLIQSTALKCLQYFSINNLPFDVQKKIAIVSMKRLRYNSYRDTSMVKIINDIPYWVAEENAIEYEQNIDGIMRFVKQDKTKAMESLLLFLYGYRTSKIADAMGLSVNTVTGNFATAKAKIKKHFNIKAA